MRYKNHVFDVPEDKVIRVIVDTDAANEADDQFAIVQALLSSRLDIKAITAAHFGNEKSEHSMEDSYNEILKILGFMNKVEPVFDVPVFRGGAGPIQSAENPTFTEASAAIVEEAMKEDSTPLYVISLGALTNVATAYLSNPEIAGKFTLIWIGGNAYPDGGWEYNLKNDVLAAQTVFSSKIPLWQVPRNTYQQMLVSMSELALHVSGCGELGSYLFNHMVEWGHTFWGKRSYLRTGECWYLGDSPAVGILLNEHEFHYHVRKAPKINDDYSYSEDDSNREIRVYDSIDSRFILSDLFAKLELFTARQ